MAIDPRGRDLKAFLAEDPGGPVVMLNLLRFVEDGRASYEAYLAHFRAHAEPLGAEVLYLGDGGTALVAEDGQAWDAVLIVRYPSRQAFSDMIADPGYQQGTHLRTGALVEAVLQATTPWPVPDPASAAEPSPTDPSAP
ncbi:DUF1330 domain-containing protein [Actinomycetospora straminea]|uniref:DUF1330 domain-containing protein n=1 Tax=Actinomycetospora straminea TaxID=663607 RepID=A0ABP9DWV2_9PSEU|nr:DUF1330 domain-containing protein [Actinomycetospora straminea]MDD7932292.1 DUF1330 domain-containing protein [Actinomycetospora straminea]